MARRAEAVDATRLRIVEATVRLHQTVGLRASVAAVAAEAGVTRVTVYRHFPDDDALIGACSAHWLSSQRLPDPIAWGRIADAEARLRAGLSDVYRFYRQGNEMLTRVYADADVLPEHIRHALEARDATFTDVLFDPLRSSSGNRSVRAALGHALSFGTWRSLCIEHGLADAGAVEIMVILVLAVSSAAPFD